MTRQSPKKILKDKAWKTFSKWIRNRDKQCVCCGSTNNLQAGHYWHNCLDFDEENINAQCARCNKWLSGNLATYGMYLLNKLGTKKFKALEKRHYMAMKGELMSEQDYINIVEKYKL
jgi:hypothetical protein